MNIIREKELHRLQKLIDLGILDTPFEKSFDQVTDIVARTLNMPIALVSLVDKDRQWFKSCVGLTVRETPRDISFCTHAIEQDQLFIVTDASQDPRFENNPLCTGEPHIRFYAGMPLKTQDGFNVGTLCIIDQKPRLLSEEHKELLKLLAGHVVALMEQRQITTALSKLAQQFLDIQKIAHTGVWSYDLITGEIDWSEEVYNIHGIELGKTITQEFLESFYPPHDRDRLSKAIQNTVQSGQPYDVSLELTDSKGNQKLVKNIATPVIENGAVIGLKGTFQDITERTQLDREIHNFFHLSENLLAIASENGHFIKINPAWKILGYSNEEILSQPFLHFVHPDDYAETVEVFNSLFAGKNVMGFENRYRKKNGNYIYLQWFSSRDARTGFVYAVAVDVTKRKAQEKFSQAILEVRNKFIELTHDKKKFFDYLLNTILSLTDGGYGFLGEILDDQKGRYLKTFALTNIAWDDQTRKFIEENLAQGIEFRNLNTLFGEVIKTEKVFISNDAPNDPKRGGIPSGHPDLKSFLGIPIHYANKFIGMVGIANRPNGFTQELVEDLTPFFDSIGSIIFSMKQEEELEKQKRMLIHNSKLAALGNIAAGVGHEINNPLAILVGQLDFIRHDLEQEGLLTPEIAKRLEKTENAALRIENIVKGLRQLARGDQSDFGVFDLSEMVTETCQFASEMIRKEGIEIALEITISMSFFGNRGRLQQVLVNLLNNAKDALKDVPREKLIKVSLFAEASSIYLRVTDNGSGIPEGIKDKIFDPFFTTKKIHEGTGIGLSLSNSIIKEHKGELVVESKVGSGSSFLIKLPSFMEEKKNVTQNSQSKKLSGKVLVVDDEEDIRLFLKQLLEEMGLDVLEAGDGQQALDLYTNHPDFDVIISDVRMPKINGLELLQNLRDLGYKGGFYFITGGDHPSISAQKLNYQGIIEKPFTPTSIKLALDVTLAT